MSGYKRSLPSLLSEMHLDLGVVTHWIFSTVIHPSKNSGGCSFHCRILLCAHTPSELRVSECRGEISLSCSSRHPLKERSLWKARGGSVLCTSQSDSNDDEWYACVIVTRLHNGESDHAHNGWLLPGGAGDRVSDCKTACKTDQESGVNSIQF